MEIYNRININEICKKVCSGGTPKSTHTEYYGGNIPWLNTKEVDFNRIYKTEKNITESGLENSSAKWIEPNAIIVAMYGATAGKTAIAKIPLTTNQACCNLMVDENKADYRFVYYALCDDYIRLASMANGGAQQNLNAQQIKDFDIPYPPLPTQQKIANILSSLDDKIEVNRRINEQLEELAQALFKSWFVDFEPFKDGEFVDSELGMIPKGWKVGTFSNVVDSTLGGDWGKENLQGNYAKEVFCIRGADIPEIKNGNRGKMPIRYILEKNFAKKSLANNDLVVEISGGSPTQSTGRVCRVTSELLEKYNNSLICTNFCRAIKPFADYSAYIYYYWQYLYDQGTMFNYENGTTGIKNLMINDILDKEPIVIPPINIVEQYKDVVETFAIKIQKNGEEIEKLTTLRDTLLPKLMSGEIDVNEVEI